MRQIAMLLIGCLTALAINGCGEPDVVFKDCVTPDVKEPIIDNSRKKDMLSSTKQCVRNYLSVKQYAAELLKANGVCK